MKRIITEKTSKFYGFIHSSHEIISIGHTSIIIKIRNDYNSYFLVAYKIFKENNNYFYIDAQNIFYPHDPKTTKLNYWKAYPITGKKDCEIYKISENSIKILDKNNNHLLFSSEKDRILSFNFNY